MGREMLSLGKCEMNDTAAFRQRIRSILNGARAKVHDYTGLYADEDLTSDVLRVCDNVTERVASDPRLEQAKLIVEDRCRRLALATDRFVPRDLAFISKARAQAIAAIDALQDIVLELRKADESNRHLGSLLKRRSV
jgi:hypothetical protein